MKVQPLTSPTTTIDTGGGSRTPTALAARERAIAKLTQPPPISPPGAQVQQHPVLDPSRVSAEEMTAITGGSSSQDGQTSQVEASSANTEAVTPAKAPEEPISSQYAVLARKEKAFRQRVAADQAAIKAEREALERTKAELAAKDAEYQSKYISKDRLSEDTIGALLDAGISYDQITQLMLNQGNQQQDPQTRAHLAKLEAQIKAQNAYIEESKQANKAAQDTQYNEAVKQITHEATQLVTQDPQFEAIRETRSVADVVDLIKKTFEEDGVLMTVEEAALEVENELMERLSHYTQKINKLKQKIQSPKTTPQQSVQNKTGQLAQSKTLTNSMGAARPLSARERAMLAFENKLAK